MEIASGMFVPMLLIGAVLGRLAGLLMVDVFPVDPGSMWWLPASDAQWKWIDPGVFAVVGAAAFMGGVTRLTVALAAIMMEVCHLPDAWNGGGGTIVCTCAREYQDSSAC